MVVCCEWLDVYDSNKILRTDGHDDLKKLFHNLINADDMRSFFINTFNIVSTMDLVHYEYHIE